MDEYAITDVPKLEVMRGIDSSIQRYDPLAVQRFSYEGSDHEELPHVVKFSGGRSSGMLLFILLEAGLLKAERGDVVIFNNTSAEHPKTYEFARRCKDMVETKYGIPFFWLEYQTYEDARGGEWTRLSSFRLVNSQPWSETNPDGYHWRGEVYEELLSWTGFVPNIFQRTCTHHLKLETTRAFLKEWFTGKRETRRLGHFGNGSRLEDDALYETHLRNGGSVPREIFLGKKTYARTCPWYRPAQAYDNFSSSFRAFHSQYLKKHISGEHIVFGEDGVEYLNFVGLRADEPHRVARVRQRNGGGAEFVGYQGEQAYMPLFEMGVTRKDVEAFWNKQSWDLELNARDGLSNCTYCFLKGLSGLQNVRLALANRSNEELKDTPCDLDWWVTMERKYGRDLKAEMRQTRRDVPGNFIGFFGGGNGFSYRRLAESQETKESLSEFVESVLPCDCTD